jgi:hypothetical protein
MTKHEESKSASPYKGTPVIAKWGRIIATGVAFAPSGEIQLQSIQNPEWLFAPETSLPKWVIKERERLLSQHIEISHLLGDLLYTVKDAKMKDHKSLLTIVFGDKARTKWKIQKTTSTYPKKYEKTSFTESTKETQKTFQQSKTVTFGRKDDGSRYKVISSNYPQSKSRKQKFQLENDMRNLKYTPQVVKKRLGLTNITQVKSFARKANINKEDYNQVVYTAEEYEQIKKLVVEYNNNKLSK